MVLMKEVNNPRVIKGRKKMKILAAVLFFTAMTFPAHAQEAERSSDQETEQSTKITNLMEQVPVLKRFTFEWTPVPVLTSRNGKFQAKLRGRVFWDNAWINNSDNTINLDGSEFRSTRIGIDGKYGDKFAFRIEIDLAPDVKIYKDFFLQWNGWATIKVGYHKFGTPMEGSSSGRFIPFMERAAMINAFGFSRKNGVSLTKNFGNNMIQIGFGGGDVDFAKISSPGLQFSARGVHAIPIERGYIHLGATINHLKTTEIQTKFLYAARPFQNQAPVLINTGRIADSQTSFGFEAGVFRGPFSLMSETGFLNASLGSPLPGQSDPTFWGWNITASYFLTGEDSPYNPKSGTYGRPKVINPVLKGGTGAIQLAARFDYIDLVDSGIFGGIQKTFVVGLNWWLAEHVRLMFNYSRSDISQAFLVPENGPDGANNVHTFGIRTQIDW